MDAGFYTSPLWRAARAEALARDSNRCTAAEQYGPLTLACGEARGVQVHHVVRPEEGGAPYALANLCCLCPYHHRRLHGLLPLRQDDRRRRQRANAAAYQPYRAA